MKSTLSIILAVFVVTGTVGTPLSVHHCYSLDETSVALQIEDHCCSDVNQTGINVLVVTECCDFFSTYFQVDFEAFSHASALHLVLPVVFADSVKFTPLNSSLQKLFGACFYRFKPQLNGRQLLVMVQTFII